MKEWIESEDFLSFIRSGGKWLDVRAPIEYEDHQLPNSINLSILNDTERAEIGTLYKKSGQADAVARGHQLVSGAVKEERILGWKNLLENHPEMAITCARGGMRSALAQEWLADAGMQRPRARGGVKALRDFYSDSFARLIKHPFCTVGGPTGSGKTILLNELRALELKGLTRPATLDLEALAHHRGSAFGSTQNPQPGQATFENRVAHRLIELEAANIKLDNSQLNSQLNSQSSSQPKAQLNSVTNSQQELAHAWFVESESRMIGQIVLMPELHRTINLSPLIHVRESLETRVENTFQEYIQQTSLNGDDDQAALLVFESYKKSLSKISKKLGSQRTLEIGQMIAACESDYLKSRETCGNRSWIRELLIQYYDPMYEHGMKTRGGKIAFEGNRNQCLLFMRDVSFL